MVRIVDSEKLENKLLTKVSSRLLMLGQLRLQAGVTSPTPSKEVPQAHHLSTKPAEAQTLISIMLTVTLLASTLPLKDSHT